MIFKKSVRMISLFTLAIFIFFTVSLNITYSQDNNPKVKAEKSQSQTYSSNIENKESTPNSSIANDNNEKLEPGVQEKESPNPKIKKKKKFPWFWVAVGTIAVVVTIMYLTKKKSPTLTATVGDGVMGNPNGKQAYRKGEIANYSYSLLGGYANLSVLLDGVPVQPNGTIVMDKNYSLAASAIKFTSIYANGKLTINGIQYDFAAIPAGAFKMGSPDSGYQWERPIHTVKITKPFWICKTEVTQGLWKAVMGNDENDSNYKLGDDYPVDQVFWFQCAEFTEKLNALVGGNYFRLPTEAEWEYACRAGTTSERYGDLNSIAWHGNNSGAMPHPVGNKQPNSWGLYDMLGNVEEWCQDWWGEDYYSQSPSQDPTGPASGTRKVLRGGNWNGFPEDVRSSYRHSYNAPNYSSYYIGFRIAANSAGN
jgi:formylglycine-generating enzyme required for sulfatase activity